jgi:AraC-like DNA-binding protein
MEIQNLNPNPVLHDFVSNYTFVNDNSLLSTITMHGTASGNAQLYFFYDPIEVDIVRMHTGETYSGVYNTLLTGQFTGPTIINLNSRVRGGIIDFTPVGIMNLFNISGKELYESFYEADEVLGRDFICLLEQIQEQKTNYKKKETFDDYFLTKINKQNLSYSCTKLNPAVQHIIQKNGCLNMSNLRDMTGISKRYFEKQFKELVGIKPSSLKRIVRANHAICLLQQNYDYFDIIAELNYYDQTHFIKEVKWLCGITPRKLKNKNLATFGDSISVLEQKS